MAENQNFRSAFNGFNREDVVHYIEYLNSKHASEISKLNSEMEFLQGKADLAAVPMETQTDDNPIIEQQAARIRELFDQCQAQEQEIAALKAENERLTAELESAQQQEAHPYRMEEELEAYRRAERTERLARERAEQVYSQANGALADATVKVDAAATQIGELSDQVMQQLAELQAAVAGSKDALTGAAAIMYAIRPNTEE